MLRPGGGVACPDHGFEQGDVEAGLQFDDLHVLGQRIDLAQARLAALGCRLVDEGLEVLCEIRLAGGRLEADHLGGQRGVERLGSRDQCRLAAIRAGLFTQVLGHVGLQGLRIIGVENHVAQALAIGIAHVVGQVLVQRLRHGGRRLGEQIGHFIGREHAIRRARLRLLSGRPGGTAGQQQRPHEYSDQIGFRLWFHVSPVH